MLVCSYVDIIFTLYVLVFDSMKILIAGILSMFLIRQEFN